MSNVITKEITITPHQIIDLYSYIPEELIRKSFGVGHRIFFHIKTKKDNKWKMLPVNELVQEINEKKRYEHGYLIHEGTALIAGGKTEAHSYLQVVKEYAEYDSTEINTSPHLSSLQSAVNANNRLPNNFIKKFAYVALQGGIEDISSYEEKAVIEVIFYTINSTENNKSFTPEPFVFQFYMTAKFNKSELLEMKNLKNEAPIITGRKNTEIAPGKLKFFSIYDPENDPIKIEIFGIKVEKAGDVIPMFMGRQIKNFNAEKASEIIYMTHDQFEKEFYFINKMDKSQEGIQSCSVKINFRITDKWGNVRRGTVERDLVEKPAELYSF